MSQLFRILYQDPYVVAVDKPEGLFTHQYEDTTEHRVPNHLNGMVRLRRQLGESVYPVHRLDRATSGVLLYARSSEAAGAFSGLFSKREVQKTYICVVRGYWPKELVRVEEDGITEIECLAHKEFPYAVGRYPTSRASLILAKPLTGKYHQIRKHCSKSAHPVIGDTQHGDLHQNRFFKNQLGITGLCLKAACLEFQHPVTGETTRIFSRFVSKWSQIFDLFGVCPYLGTVRKSELPRPSYALGKDAEY